MSLSSRSILSKIPGSMQVCVFHLLQHEANMVDGYGMSPVFGSSLLNSLHTKGARR